MVINLYRSSNIVVSVCLVQYNNIIHVYTADHLVNLDGGAQGEFDTASAWASKM